jgi:hypothetical protein
MYSAQAARFDSSSSDDDDDEVTAVWRLRVESLTGVDKH